MLGQTILAISGKSSVGKVVSCFIGGIIGFFAPVGNLILMVIEFIFVDFFIGIWASRARAKKAGRLSEWGFESLKAWRTIWKLVFAVIGIVLAYHLDELVLSFVDLHLARIFCGFICGVELWSFLENAACISNHPVFRWLSKYMGKKVRDAGVDIESFKLSEHDDDASEANQK